MPIPLLRRLILRLALLIASSAFLLPPFARASSIFTSQVGYTSSDPKTAVLAVPQGTPIQAFFRVLAAGTGQAVFTGSTNEIQDYPGGWIGSDATGDTYLLDFSGATLASGQYQVESNGVLSLPFWVGADVYNIAKFHPLEFFRIQLSGVAGSWQSLDGSVGAHGPDHLDDGRQAARRDRGGGDRALIEQDYLALPGGHLDVSGGWSDAGDYNKYMGNTPWAAYLLLLTKEEYGAYWDSVDEDHNGEPDITQYVRPALEWMLKMQHFDGSVYERVFNGYSALFDGRPDLETDNTSGNSDDRPLDTDRYADITAKSSYALAVAYRIFHDTRYLDSAIAAWNWAYNNQSIVKPKVYGGGLYFGDLEIGLTLGAIEIHLAQEAAGLNPDPKFLTYAQAHIQTHLALGDWINPSSWDYQQSFALMRYFELSSDPAEKAQIVTQLRARWDAGIQKQHQNAYRMNDEWLYGDFGQNENSASSAGDALWVFNYTGESKYYDYAVNQMAWIFGRNPFGESWLASAAVSEYTRVPHWRGTAMHPIEGVVVPGATDRNSNHIPDYTDTGDWFYSEPTINQQAMFIRVMTSLYLASGGTVDPPDNLPPSITITQPSDSAAVSGLITLKANVGDSDGVAAVAYRLDGGIATPMQLISGDTNFGEWQADIDTTGLADGNHSLTVEATDTAVLQSSISITVSVNNGGQPKLHVEHVEVVLLQKGAKRIQGRCDITVFDAFRLPVAGATIEGHWEDAANDNFTTTTDANGIATDYSNSTNVASGLTFRCVVDQVSKSGWAYDADANTEISGSAMVP